MERRRVLRLFYKRAALLTLNEIMEVIDNEINKKDKILVRKWMAMRAKRDSSEIYCFFKIHYF